VESLGVHHHLGPDPNSHSVVAYDAMDRLGPVSWLVESSICTAYPGRGVFSFSLARCTRLSLGERIRVTIFPAC
jgi:hypothetical protein